MVLRNTQKTLIIFLIYVDHKSSVEGFLMIRKEPLSEKIKRE